MALCSSSDTCKEGIIASSSSTSSNTTLWCQCFLSFMLAPQSTILSSLLAYASECGFQVVGVRIYTSSSPCRSCKLSLTLGKYENIPKVTMVCRTWFLEMWSHGHPLLGHWCVSWVCHLLLSQLPSV